MKINPKPQTLKLVLILFHNICIGLRVCVELSFIIANVGIDTTLGLFGITFHTDKSG
jgi:hypothetical protein